MTVSWSSVVTAFVLVIASSALPAQHTHAAPRAAVPTAQTSANLGGGWSWADPAPQGNDLRGVTCIDSTHCSAGGSFGTILAKTGSSWQPVGTGFEATLNDLACWTVTSCVAVGVNTIVGTTDGVTWVSRAAGTLYSFNGVSCPGATLCVAAGFHKIFRSQDGGLTWSVQFTGSGFFRDITCATTSSCVAVGSNGLAATSADGGGTWAVGTPGTTASLASVACSTATTCVAVGSTNTGTGVAVRSTDGGSHWTSTSVPSTEAGVGVSCPTATACIAVTAFGQALVSSDAGASWTAQPIFGNTTLHASPWTLTDVACASASACVTVGAAGLIAATSDGGAHWTLQGSGVHDDLGSVTCPTVTVCLASGDEGTVLRSDDGGASWAAQSTGLTFRIWGISCATTSTCAAPPLYTVDGGTTWAHTSTFLNGPAAAVACPTATRCYLTQPGKTFMSNDGGASWSPQYASGSSGLWAISCASATFCIAVGDGGLILRTADGTTWTAQASGSTRQLLSVSCPSTSTCYVGGGSGLMVSTDGGISWSTKAAPAPFYSLGCPTVTTCFYLGAANVTSTADSGATWYRKPLLATPRFGSMACPAADTCVGVGAFGAVMRGIGLTPELPRRLLLPAMSNGAYGGYVTAAYFRNLGSGPADVVINYYDQSGGLVGFGNWGVIPPGAGWTARQDDFQSFDTGQAGSAIVFSDQPLSAFVNEFAPAANGDATSYTSIPSSGSGAVLYAPTIVNGAYGGYTTGIGLLVAGDTPADVTITYRDLSGASVLVQPFSGLAPRSYTAIYSGSVGLPSGFAGTATITSSGSALAAVVNEVGPGNQFSSYDALASGSSTVDIPVALNNAYGGFFTGMGIQNTTNVAGTVQVDYYDSAGGITTRIKPIAANGYLGLYQGSATDGPPAGAYTAVVSGSAGVQLATVVNEVAPASGASQQSTSFNGFAAGTTTSNLALTESAGLDGFSTGEGIMNVGTTPASVSVSYYDVLTGNPIGTTQSALVPGHAFWGVYQPVSGLSAGLSATAVVNVSAGAVAVVCNESGTYTFMGYAGQ